jgi:chemotaxis protein methyltransferase CheR
MTWTHPTHEAITRLVAARTGLQFPDNRHDHAQQVIRRAMERSGSRSVQDYLALLQSDAAALDDLVGELTVSETYFFREPAQFDFLRREVLPDLRRRRSAGHVFRAWSAGCATGEEVYSLAILFEQEGLGEQVHLLGTDISRAALTRAQQGVYSNWSLRGPGAALAGPYLVQRGKQHVLAEKIRRRVVLEYLNLAQDVYPSFANDTWGMDLILCRNVLIYLDRQTVERVARRLFDSLAPDGWLLTASSDPPLQDRAPFATVVCEAGVFYRRPSETEEREKEEREASPCLSVPPSSPVVLPPPLSSRSASDRDDAARRVRALADKNAIEAERACAAALEQQPLAVELRYLHAVLLMDLGRTDEAIQALRRTIYLDRSLAVAHFTLGALLGQSGDLAGARAAYRNAAALCAARPADEIVPLADGEHAGRLARAAAFQTALLAGREMAP